MSANHDKIAWIYDFLSRLVFGNYVVKTQASLLSYIPANSRVLIVGGGTGWILEEIGKLRSNGLSIDYVEPSAEMIRLSQKRNYGNNTVNFIQLPIEDLTAAGSYDIVLTPFVFDIIGADKIEGIFYKLDALLKDRGVWLFADFVYDENQSPFWQIFLLKAMYLFFRLTCRIEARHLVSMDRYFASGYEKIFEAEYYFRFMKGTVYRKK